MFWDQLRLRPLSLGLRLGSVGDLDKTAPKHIVFSAYEPRPKWSRNCDALLKGRYEIRCHVFDRPYAYYKSVIIKRHQKMYIEIHKIHLKNTCTYFEIADTTR